ncbi:MAG TPA: radical SAM protein [Anaerolineae bacterium]|nr:radical SAM protein [Anaerolineae bacterium]HQI83114.1 radical SAM protein [Anaerolineae bacterium]
MTVCDPLPDDAPETAAPALNLPDGVPPLTSFYLYLTDGCNLHCRHCWIAPRFVNGKPDPGECLDLDLLRKAVAEAKPLGLRNAKLTGGEPTLHPQFVEIADYLTAEGLSLTMETNGTLIDAALARHLKEKTSLWFVSVSLDGPNAEIHDAFRRVPGSFDAATRGLKHLVDAGYKPQVIMSVHKGNIQFIEDVVKMAVDAGAGSVKFNPVTSTGRGIALHQHGEALDAEEILELVHWIRGELQGRTPISLILSTPLAFYTVGELLHSGSNGACHVRHILGILGDGQMALCGIGRTIPALAFGNVCSISVAEVWQNHSVLLQLRTDLNGPYSGVCGLCIHAPRCLTYCVAQNYQDNGTLVSPHWLCAELDERGLFPAARQVTYG